MYQDVNEGVIPADRCGPEREAFADPGGEWFKPYEPIPQPRPDRDARAMGDACV